MFRLTKKFSLTLVAIAAMLAFTGSVFAATSTKPVVSGFSASPSLLNYSGGSVTLSATIKNATRCIFTVKPAAAGVSKSVTCNKGRVTYKASLPKNNSTKNTIYAFKLVVTGKKGMGTATAPLRNVIVDAPPQPVIKSFTLTPTALANTGGTITLSGTVDDALSCNLSVIPVITGLATIVPCSSAGGTLTTIAVPNNTSSLNIHYIFRLTASGIASATSSTSVVTVSSTSSPVTTTTTTTLPTVGNTVSVPAQPDAFVAAGNNIWVASCSGNAVTEINNATKEIMNVINAPNDGFNCPDALAFDGTNIWVANKLGSSITELNASTGGWVQTLTGSSILNPDALAFDGTNIWVADNSLNDDQASFISELNASTGLVVRTLDATRSTKWTLLSPTCLTFTGSRIWVSDIANNVAIEFNTANGGYLGQTRGGTANPSGIGCVSYHSGYIWISGGNNGVVVEYNATTGVFVRAIKNILNPNQLVFTGSDLFVISDDPVDSVREYNSAGTFLKTVTKDNLNSINGIRAILPDGANLWVANYSSASVTKFAL